MSKRVENAGTGWRWAVLVAILTALASAQAFGLFGGGAPTLLSPAPLPFVFIPGSFIPYGVPLFVAAFALAWCAPLLRGSGLVPRRTLVLAWLVGLTSAGWFVSAMVQRLNFSDPRYVAGMIAASLFLATATVVALRWARRNPSIRASALAHSCLFVWLVSYAYPWFGEVI